MVKFYQVKQTINGKEYIAQFNGIGAALSATDSSYIDGTDNVSTIKLSKYIFENVIVEPKGLTADSFDTLDEFQEVIKFASEVMRGNFRNKANQITD